MPRHFPPMGMLKTLWEPRIVVCRESELVSPLLDWSGTGGFCRLLFGVGLLCSIVIRCKDSTRKSTNTKTPPQDHRQKTNWNTATTKTKDTNRNTTTPPQNTITKTHNHTTNKNTTEKRSLPQKHNHTTNKNTTAPPQIKANAMCSCTKAVHYQLAQ